MVNISGKVPIYVHSEFDPSYKPMVNRTGISGVMGVIGWKEGERKERY